MSVVLILIGLAGGATPTPSVSPLVLGYFPSIDACDTAARAARMSAAGTIGSGVPTGVLFLCVQSGAEAR
jgi:hypothetical protein